MLFKGLTFVKKHVHNDKGGEYMIKALSFVRPAFAADLEIPQPTGFRITNIGRVISSVFGFLLIVAGLLAFAMLIIGGIQMITSGGDKAGLETARNRIVHAIIGLIVVFSAWAITILLQNFLGITILGNFDIPKPF